MDQSQIPPKKILEVSFYAEANGNETVRKTPNKELEIAKSRYKNLDWRLFMKKKHVGSVSMIF